MKNFRTKPGNHYEIETEKKKLEPSANFFPYVQRVKKRRDYKGYWNLIEAYISEHSAADFSHGICPECSGILYPYIYDDK